jgi:hypothetical protein
LITLPCYNRLAELLDKIVQEQNRADIRYLSDKYQLDYWDYFSLPMNPAQYANCDHLNGEGAAKFSRIVNKRLEYFIDKK